MVSIRRNVRRKGFFQGRVLVHITAETWNFQIQQLQFAVQMRTLKSCMPGDFRHLTVFVRHQTGKIRLFKVVAKFLEGAIEVERDVCAGNLQHGQRFEPLDRRSNDGGFLRFSFCCW